METVDLITGIMMEHIQMPGFPQIIVTREFAYFWLKERGWSPRERGFGSLDYMSFGRNAINVPLTKESERDHWLGQAAKGYRR
jgi:hypothetical protein